MSSTQLKLDQFWSRHEPSSKPVSFSSTNEIKVFSLNPSFNSIICHITNSVLLIKADFKKTFLI
jgi:hypothetical protein